MASLTQTIRQSCHRVYNGRSSSPQAGKKRVVPPIIRLTGLGFNLLSIFQREWVSSRLADLWFRVFKPKPRQWVHAFWSQADRSVELHLADKTIPVYLWGHGPLVVCLHGWGGSGTQFRHLIPDLVAQGYQVASFDAPAHGLNPGRNTHLLEFSACLHAIRQQTGPVHTVIAHSFGAMATLMAGYQGFVSSQMILLAPGLDVQELFDSYCEALSLEAKLVQRFHHKVGQKMADIVEMDDPWAFFHPDRLLRHATTKGLLIYDQQDEEITLQHFETIAGQWSQSESFATTGLGHFRLLKAPLVINRITQWMGSAS